MRRDFVTRASSITHLALVLLALASCKKKGPAEYTYSVFVPRGDAELVGVEQAGKRLAAKSTIPAGTYYDVVVPATEYVVEKSFDAIVKTSCGETKLPAKVVVGITKSDYPDGEKRERDQAKAGAPVLAELTFTLPQVADVFVDGDGAITIGALPIDAGSKRFHVALGSCPTGRDVLVGGAKVGTLDVKPRTVDGKDVPGTALIDATGGACYMRLLHVYTKKDDPTGGAPITPERLEGQRVYVVDIDDFLTPSPKELTTAAFLPSRSEIRRCYPLEVSKPSTKAPPKSKAKKR